MERGGKAYIAAGLPAFACHTTFRRVSWFGVRAAITLVAAKIVAAPMGRKLLAGRPRREKRYELRR
jgi:hypothetical protein